MNSIVNSLNGVKLPPESELWPIDDVEFIRFPFPYYERIRNLAPLYVMEDGSYLISNYEDTIKYLKHPIMSAVEPKSPKENPWEYFYHTMLFADPPLHTERRRHINKWFTPRLVRDWVQTTAQVTQAKLDALKECEVIDAYEKISVESTHITVCRLLDFPEDEIYEVTRHWFNATLALREYPDDWQFKVAAEGFKYLHERVDQILKAKLENPGHGLADEMLAKYKSGEIETYQEIVEIIVMIYASGGHNPGFMITAGIETFARQPELFQEYKNNPVIRKNFVNELIRMNPPELIMSRYPKEEIEIRGVKIPPKARVKFLLGGANYDPAYFENPYVFDVNRPTEHSMNLSFGIGAHSCAGQVLSRAECETIFTILAERFSSIELAEEPVTDHTERVRSYSHLKVKFMK